MSKTKPLVTDMSELIRGATEKPAPMVIGEKQDVIEQKPPTPEKPRQRASKPRPGKGRAPTAPAWPWSDANPKITKFVQVRMPEPLDIKLDWIKQNSIGQISKHEIILKAIEAAADRLVDDIVKRNRGG